MTTLVAENLGKSYGDAVILEGIGFQANPGDSIAFMSPSGSGKSTLLSMLGLLLTPTTGRVVVDGVDTSTMNDKQLSKLRLENVGFVFQHTQLIGSLRAIENVTVPANFSAQGAKTKTEQAREMLCRLGLEKRLLHYPHQLSVGQKRRVALARALVMDPPIVIADEPTNDLDAESRNSVADALFDRCAQGGILLFATHDEELASRATRIMRLDGKTFKEV